MRVFLLNLVLFGCIGSCYAEGTQGRLIFSGAVKINATGHAATLTWQATGSASYNVYRSSTHGGPYAKIASGVAFAAYNDNQVSHNQLLYYVVTAVSGGNESGYSNEAIAVIP